MSAKEVEETLLYICDPEKNTGCSKTACHINDGPCEYTTHSEYARVGTMPIKTKHIKDILDEEDKENV